MPTNSESSTELRAAAASVDLEPPENVWMSGFGARVTPSIGVHDPIMARAVVVSDGLKNIALISVDCVGLDPDSVSRIRAGLSGQGFDESCVLVSTTHTHSGPATMRFRSVMGHVDADWLASVESRVVELAASLPNRLKPARMVVGTGEVAGIAINRQDRSHAIDERLVAIQFQGEDRSVLATILHYAMHPVVHGPNNLMLSAEFPGAACRSVETMVGGVAMYLQGTCGDVNPLVTTTKDSGQIRFEDTDEIGRVLALASVEALAGAEVGASGRLDGTRTLVRLPLQSFSRLGDLDKLGQTLEEQLALARATSDALAESSAVSNLEWWRDLVGKVRSGLPIDLIEAEVQVLLVGGILMVCLPFEPYTDIGLRIQEALSPRMTLILGYSNGLIGYLATDRARDQGGYGPGSSHRWFPNLLMPLDYGADSIVVKAAVALARTLEQ